MFPLPSITHSERSRIIYDVDLRTFRRTPRAPIANYNRFLYRNTNSFTERIYRSFCFYRNRKRFFYKMSTSYLFFLLELRIPRDKGRTRTLIIGNHVYDSEYFGFENAGRWKRKNSETRKMDVPDRQCTIQLINHFITAARR